MSTCRSGSATASCALTASPTRSTPTTTTSRNRGNAGIQACRGAWSGMNILSSGKGGSTPPGSRSWWSSRSTSRSLMALVAGVATACSEGPLPSLPQSFSDYGCDSVAQLLDNQGLTRSRGGDPAGAIGDFNAVLRVTPGCAIAYNNRGQAKMKLGDLQGAFEDFSEAIRLVPGYVAPYQ